MLDKIAGGLQVDVGTLFRDEEAPVEVVGLPVEVQAIVELLLGRSEEELARVRVVLPALLYAPGGRGVS